MSCEDKNHQMHMCALKAQGMDECIKKYSDHPTVECKKCGARANSSNNLCAAHLMDTAPSVEGGHGAVSLDEIGKPHEGSTVAETTDQTIATAQVPVDGICGGY